MTPTPGFRSTAAVVLAAIVLAAAYAQSPAEVLPYGSIGLYVDEGRSSNTVSYLGAPAEFTMYIFCRPGEHGMIAAEFGIAYPANVIPAAVTENPLISISLGSLDAGISVAFLACQNDWVWTHHQSLFLVNADETRIEIEKNRAADAYQFATCDLGYPVEPALISSAVCCNAACPPDTVPPLLQDARYISRNGVDLVFSEALFETSAENPLNYEIAESSEPSATLPTGQATLLADERSVRLYTTEPFLEGHTYVARAHDVRDRWGNEIPPGAERTFTVDTVPPRLLWARADGSSLVLASFSEELDIVTAENTDNYRIFETGSESVISLIAGAALARDSSSVQLSLGDTLVAGIAYSLRVIGVTDRASNPVPEGSIVPITAPDTTPPTINAVKALTLQYVKVTFDEPVAAATAGVPANYVLVHLADPSGATGPSTVDMPDDGTVGLWFIQKLVVGETYTLRVSNVTDLAGNEILAGSEKSFVCPSAATPGYIGLFVEESRRGCRINCADGFTPFKMYVWCLAGGAGQRAVEFRVVYPENVIRGAVTVNPIVSVYLGDLESDLSAVFSECSPGWEWIAVQDCYLTNHDRTTIDVGSGPISATCALGYPIDTMQILSKISCNGSVPVGTLLQDFSASYGGHCIEVAWRLSEKDDGVRFSILRTERGADGYCELSGEIVGTGLSFSYRDESVEPGKAYRYRVQYMDGAGIHILFESDPVAVPAIPLTLNQNWPNPFNPLTTISYYLPEAARVRLEIYDVAGRRIACLVNGNEERGNHNAVWNGAGESGRPAAPGIYIYRLTAGRETQSRKMVLVR